MEGIRKELFKRYVSLYQSAKSEYEGARKAYSESHGVTMEELQKTEQAREMYINAKATFNAYAEILGDFIVENLDHIELKQGGSND